MRVPIIAGNWKMNTTPDEALQLVQGIMEKNLCYSKVIIAIFPPFPYLHQSVRLIQKSILLGAQNMHWEKEGAYTGEVSGPMLKAIGCSLVILGHSERRTYFGETDEIVSRKVKAALESELRPVLCVGETLKQRECGNQKEVVENQLNQCTGGISSKEIQKIIIAYEPVWAIGTGRNATPDQAQQMHAFIREWIKCKYGNKNASEADILYGGSVNSKNAKDLLSQPDVDGALVGGASVKLESFMEIVRSAAEILEGAAQ